METNGRSGAAGPLGIGHLNLVILWSFELGHSSLVIGHWALVIVIMGTEQASWCALQTGHSRVPRRRCFFVFEQFFKFEVAGIMELDGLLVMPLGQFLKGRLLRGIDHREGE